MRLPLTTREEVEDASPPPDAGWLNRLAFGAPESVAEVVAPLINSNDSARLLQAAEDSLSGDIVCFSKWVGDFGNPIQWHRNPLTRLAWDPATRWQSALVDSTPGDIKLAWEAGRFPHAYHLARAAALFPEHRARFAQGLLEQIRNFVQSNPAGLGIHWASGQEMAFRLLSWLFAGNVLLSRTDVASEAARLMASIATSYASHIERHISYSRYAVYNNHLISEALALYAVGVLLPGSRPANRWRTIGKDILSEQAAVQFYEDGGYIQQSHNYHRLALQNYLWAVLLARTAGESVPAPWLDALDRSLEFLVAQQNDSDGQLPNYGANDGALPSILSTCDFSDMRPTLQAVSLLVHGQRSYGRGPWDEEAAWFLGPAVLESPLRKRAATSRSFPLTGHHVVRSRDGQSFATFRCGTLRERFSQIDMLHVDVWSRGHNVLVDGGSYRYNASPEWLGHFMRTPSHNTLTLDRRDQMLHYRPFKVIYWTRAKLERFHDDGDWALVEGEHYGYRRHAGGCIHGRILLYCKNDLWIVVDRVTGTGPHEARLHWLGGDFPWTSLTQGNGMQLDTPAGNFFVAVYGERGVPLKADVVAGLEGPEPRGWLSRYYGHRVPVPSLSVTRTSVLPMLFVSVLSVRPVDATWHDDIWTLTSDAGRVSMKITQGRLQTVEMVATDVAP